MEKREKHGRRLLAHPPPLFLRLPLFSGRRRRHVGRLHRVRHAAAHHRQGEFLCVDRRERNTFFTFLHSTHFNSPSSPHPDPRPVNPRHKSLSSASCVRDGLAMKGVERTTARPLLFLIFHRFFHFPPFLCVRQKPQWMPRWLAQRNTGRRRRECEARVDAALQAHLGGARRDGGGGCFTNLVERERVRTFGCRAMSSTQGRHPSTGRHRRERAKGAPIGADVGVVDVAVDNESGFAAERSLPCHISRFNQLQLPPRHRHGLRGRRWLRPASGGGCRLQWR